MDTITHIAIGACIGELFLGKKIGKKAMGYGALAAVLPDIDVVAALWLSPAQNLLVHRGLAHSILFAGVASFLMALLFSKWHVNDAISKKRWFVFLITEMAIHLFLDAFNSYGVGWFEPFNHLRLSFNILFVADPFFSAGPCIIMLLLLLLHRNHRSRVRWGVVGLLICCSYLGYAIHNKWRADQNARENFARLHIPYTRYFTTPTPLNTWLWYIVAEKDSGFYTSYHSVLDDNPEAVFSYVPRREVLLKPFADHQDLRQLVRFSKGFYIAADEHDTLVFNDIRFGQVAGWETPGAPFVFHYYLQYPDANRLVLQRGRFSNWDGHTIRSLVKKIRGK